MGLFEKQEDTSSYRHVFANIRWNRSLPHTDRRSTLVKSSSSKSIQIQGEHFSSEAFLQDTLIAKMGAINADNEILLRPIRVAAAQVGPVHRWSERAHTLQRLIKLLEDAADKGAQLVLFPELTFTTFFPRYFISDEDELKNWFEHGDDVSRSPDTMKLFQRADELEIDVCVGYAERAIDGHSYNSCVYFSAQTHSILTKYHKSHLPGTKEPYTDPDAINQLEKRYFEEGQDGFKAFRVPGLLDNAIKNSSEIAKNTSSEGRGDPIIGLLICNDRRWAEAWRVYGLQGTELVLCGYNTTSWAPHLHGKTGVRSQSREQSREDAYFHHKLVMQSNSYTNSCFSVCAARCGLDDNEFGLIGGSCIVGPNGRIIAEAKTEDDELIFAEIDLADCRPGKETTFDFGRHRRPELYKLLVEQKGVVEPDLLPA